MASTVYETDNCLAVIARCLFILQSVSVLAIIIHPHFLICPFHLPSTVLQKQTIIALIVSLCAKYAC